MPVVSGERLRAGVGVLRECGLPGRAPQHRTLNVGESSGRARRRPSRRVAPMLACRPPRAAATVRLTCGQGPVPRPSPTPLPRAPAEHRGPTERYLGERPGSFRSAPYGSRRRPQFSTKLALGSPSLGCSSPVKTVPLHPQRSDPPPGRSLDRLSARQHEPAAPPHDPLPDAGTGPRRPARRIKRRRLRRLQASSTKARRPNNLRATVQIGASGPRAATCTSRSTTARRPSRTWRRTARPPISTSATSGPSSSWTVKRAGEARPSRSAAPPTT